jgi:Protein of unknown function (DUF1629)
MSSTEKPPRKPKARKFYCIGLDFRFRTPPGWQMENLAVLNGGHRTLLAPLGARGFPQFPEPPRLLIDRALGRAPVDWELFHDYWIVSDRMKTVLETLDREGVAFVRCETRYQGGSAAPVYWLCDVLRLLDAVDEEKSRVKIKHYDSDYKVYDLMGGASLVFKEEVVGSAHIFRLRFLHPRIICDQSVKDACKDAGLRGIRFVDASDC